MLDNPIVYVFHVFVAIIFSHVQEKKLCKTILGAARLNLLPQQQTHYQDSSWACGTELQPIKQNPAGRISHKLPWLQNMCALFVTFYLGPHDLWIHVLLPSFIFLTENNICPFLVHVNVKKLSNQCGQNKIYKNPRLSIFSCPLLFGHLKGLTSVLFCCLVALSKHAYFDF